MLICFIKIVARTLWKLFFKKSVGKKYRCKKEFINKATNKLLKKFFQDHCMWNKYKCKKNVQWKTLKINQNFYEIPSIVR